jgi:hypothetical protein
MTSTSTVHTATRDAVLATRTGSLADYSATSDTGASYAVLGPVPEDGTSVYAVGRRHGNIVLVTRTGAVAVRGKGAQVRVRIMFARDTGDADGTLSFDAYGSEHIGGVAPRVLFA